MSRPVPPWVVYVCCVVSELAAIALGSRLLTHLGHDDLRPALISGVAVVHLFRFALTLVNECSLDSVCP